MKLQETLLWASAFKMLLSLYFALAIIMVTVQYCCDQAMHAKWRLWKRFFFSKCVTTFHCTLTCKEFPFHLSDGSCWLPCWWYCYCAPRRSRIHAEFFVKVSKHVTGVLISRKHCSVPVLSIVSFLLAVEFVTNCWSRYVHMYILVDMVALNGCWHSWKWPLQLGTLLMKALYRFAFTLPFHSKNPNIMHLCLSSSFYPQ